MNPRVIPGAHFSARTGFGRVPQIWNVPPGLDMSLVGPRPVTAASCTANGDARGAYQSCAPASNRLWQVAGRGVNAALITRNA